MAFKETPKREETSTKEEFAKAMSEMFGIDIRYVDGGEATEEPATTDEEYKVVDLSGLSAQAKLKLIIDNTLNDLITEEAQLESPEELLDLIAVVNQTKNL